MASRQKLDAPGCARCGQLISLLLLLFALPVQWLGAQQPFDGSGPGRSDKDRFVAAKTAFDLQQWQQAAKIAEGPPNQSAELDFLRGLALAKLQTWEGAADAFASGHRKDPLDPRFLVELAGVRYKQKNFSAAKRGLRAALALQSHDAYTLEFLATVHFLEGNLEAALKYWNRIDKPHLRSVGIQPTPRLDEAILRRAVTFNAPQIFTEEALLAADSRLNNLGIFPRRRIELTSAAENFDATLHLAERNGFGDSKLDAWLAPLSGLPYATVYPEVFNLRHRAVNATSLLRWDAEKRRAFAAFSMPFHGDPARQFEIYFDGRNENWNLTNTFFTSETQPSDLNLRRIAGGLKFRSVVGARWSWSTGLEVASRSFRNFGAARSTSTAAFFTDSTSFRYFLRADSSLLRVPERRFNLDSSAEGSLGRFYADGLGAFGGTRAAVTAHWLPRASGDDYEMRAQFRVGAAFGSAPLDELFQLGIEHDDNDLWLRGHPATTGGRKGAAPLGRRYALANWELDKNLYSNGIVTLKLGPFLDSGAIADSSGFFGSREWLWDTGAQCKIRILSSIIVVLIYGHDLRGARDNFYPTVLH
jgi:tetratricopeptide (TPR) repeat protein